jgi:Tfp pilus assembly protein PilO
MKIPNALKFDLADIRNLDIRDVADWPWFPRFILLGFIALGIVLLLFLIDGLKQLSEIRSLRSQQEHLLQEIKQHQSKIRYQGLYFSYYQKNEERLRKAIGEIPPAHNIEDAFAVLADIAKKNGVVIRRFARDQLIRHELYSEQLMSMTITGSFYQLGHFMADAAKLPYVIYFPKFVLSPQGEYLRFEATASVLLQGGV